MELKLNWLQTELSLTNSQLYTMIKNTPPLLGLSVPNNLEPTVNFYMESIETDEDSLTFVVNNPAMLTMSLKGRLLPRLEEIKEAGVLINIACLRRIAILTDEKWDEWVSTRN